MARQITHMQSWHVNDYTYIFLGPFSIVPNLQVEEKKKKKALHGMTHESVKIKFKAGGGGV